MAEKQTLEREYVIPLRRFWLNVPQYERSRKAIKTIKKFIAKHMKVQDRDEDKVKLDVYFNNEVWFRGRANPPAKVKVKAVKENGVVKVTFAQAPEHIKFLESKNAKMHKKLEKKTEIKSEQVKEKTEEEKKNEQEKEKAVADANIKQAEQTKKADKHTTPVKEPKIQRMALKK